MEDLYDEYKEIVDLLQNKTQIHFFKYNSSVDNDYQYEFFENISMSNYTAPEEDVKFNYTYLKLLEPNSTVFQ